MCRSMDVESIPLHLYRERLAIKFKRYLVGETLLDVGCGDGMWISYCFSQKFSHVVGVDVIKSVFWSVRPPNVDFIVCDAMHLPFVDRAFDLCFLNNILHHVKMPLIILERVKECAKSTIIVVEANRYDPIGFIHMVKLHGHDHFSRDKFIETISQAYGSCLRCSFYHARSHYVPISNVLLTRVCRLIMDLLERGHQSSHNIAVCIHNSCRRSDL